MKTITKEEIQKLITDKQEFVLLNALRPDSFAKVHIPDSINIPIRLDGFDENVGEFIPNKEQMVITYCANPDWTSSADAAGRLEELGYKNVYDYEGGLKDWLKARLPVIRGRKIWVNKLLRNFILNSNINSNLQYFQDSLGFYVFHSFVSTKERNKKNSSLLLYLFPDG